MLVIGAAAALAGGILFWSTPYGLGMNPDSVVYFTAAKSVAEGRGFLEFEGPLTLHGAGYPALLSIAFLGGGDPMTSARLLHAVVFALGVFLVGAAAALSTEGCLTASLVSIAFFLASENIWGIYTLAWSEGPFVGLVLGASILFVRHITRPRAVFLAASALLLGLAMWTRFLGTTLLPPMLALLWIHDRREIRKRARDGLLFTAVAAAPLAAWTVRNALVAGSAAGRSFVPHVVSGADLRELVHRVYAYFLPVEMWGWLEAVQLAFLALLAVFALRKIGGLRIRGGRAPGAADLFHTLIPLFLGCYVAVLLFSISFLDALTRIDQRILAPLYPFVVVFAVSLAWNAAKNAREPYIWKGFLVFSFFLITTQGNRAVSFVSITHREGRGYTNAAWRSSEGIRYARSVPEGRTIYSNGPEAIRFLTGREARFLPRSLSPNTLRPNDRLDEEMDGIRTATVRGDAVVVYFDGLEREQMVGREEFGKKTGLGPTRLLGDAAVYEADAPAPSP
jgi:hypothetical protein